MAYDKNHPFMARLVDRQRLSGEKSQKDIYRLEIDLIGSEITYEPGDWLAVLPENSEAEVRHLLDRLDLSEDQELRLPRLADPLPTGDALRSHLTISRVHKPLILWLADHSPAGHTTERLKALLADPSLEAQIAGRSVADFLEEYDLKIQDAETFLCQLKPVLPRLYSIASSPKKRPHSIELVVATAHFHGPDGQIRDGLASGFLNHRLSVGDGLKIYPVRTRMKMPSDGAPMIMVGPGVGIAPFLGFLQEKEMGPEKFGRCWLFFGDRHRESDFICEGTLKNHLKGGVLDRLSLAFSRDQAEKVYVQHKLLAEKDEVWQWIQDGAYFYVCGDSKMGRDVERTLLMILEDCAEFATDRAQLFLQDLKKSRRYQQDVY